MHRILGSSIMTFYATKSSFRVQWSDLCKKFMDDNWQVMKKDLILVPWKLEGEQMKPYNGHQTELWR